MTATTGIAFQAGLAGRVEDVPAAMSATHDALLQQWGDDRTSGVSWELYGHPLASAIGRVRGVPTGNGLAGDLPEGWARLEELLSVATEEMAEAYLNNIQMRALMYAVPTLVIAFCNVRRYTP